MMLRILGLFFVAPFVFAQNPLVFADLVESTDSRPSAGGTPCNIREVGSRQDWLHPSELRFVSCIYYDDGRGFDLTLNGDAFRFTGGEFSETKSFYIYQDTSPSYNFPVVNGIRFQMYAILHSQAVAESYYHYILRHGDRFYRLSEEPIAALFYDEGSGFFYSIQGWHSRGSEPVTYKEFYDLDFKKRTLSKVREEYIVGTFETSP